MTSLSSRETGPIARSLFIGFLLLGLAACATEPPGLVRADGSAATLGPTAAVVLESRDVEVEDPYANQNHIGAAYTGAVVSTIVADAMSNDGAVVAAAMLAGLGAGWMIGEFGEDTLPGHAYVVKDTASGEVYIVVQPKRGNDWLLPPGTEVFVIGESRAARVVPETDESWFWERPEPEPIAPPVVWREPRPEGPGP
jgi:hypothetical protein